VKHAYDEPYAYHSLIIEILLKCIEGEEGLKLNIPKIKSIMNLHYFLVLLQDDHIGEL
jgi:hypothetical protein